MIYLDNAATSFPKPQAVYDTLAVFMKEAGANPGRTGHKMAVLAERAIDETRTALAKLFHAEDKSRVIFTLNCTDSLNIALKGVLQKGDHVITSVLEHNSVSRPLRALSEAGLIEVTKVEPDAEGFLTLDAVRAAFRPNTKLVALTHASNVTGVVQDAAGLGALAHEKGALFLLDAAQTAGVLDIDVQRDHVDLLAAPGHKALFGPTGTGVLYVGPRVKIAQWRQGGTGLDSESELHPAVFPFHLEGGTPNTLGLAGLGAGLKFLADTGLDAVKAHEDKLLSVLYEELGNDPRFTLYGTRDLSRRVCTLSFTVEGLEPAEIGAILDESFNIACRTGLHCAPFAHQSLGTFPTGTIRISPGYFTTADELKTLTAGLKEIVG